MKFPINRVPAGRKIAERWNGIKVLVSKRCPGNGHEATPWTNGSIIECASCGRIMPETAIDQAAVWIEQTS